MAKQEGEVVQGKKIELTDGGLQFLKSVARTYQKQIAEAIAAG